MYTYVDVVMLMLTRYYLRNQHLISQPHWLFKVNFIILLYYLLYYIILYILYYTTCIHLRAPWYAYRYTLLKVSVFYAIQMTILTTSRTLCHWFEVLIKETCLYNEGQKSEVKAVLHSQPVNCVHILLYNNHFPADIKKTPSKCDFTNIYFKTPEKHAW